MRTKKEITQMKAAALKNVIEKDERLLYWNYVLQGLGDDFDEFVIDKNVFSANFTAKDIDEHVKQNYASRLKDPEVMARILGSK